MHASLIEKGSIAATQIDEPELTDVLELYERVYSGDFRQVQNKRIGRGSPDRTSLLKDVAFALRFEPGALRFRAIHETVSTKKQNARKTKAAAEFYA
jgi:hypothetical protein